MKKAIKYLSLFFLILAIMLVCVSFTACGGEDDGTDDGEISGEVLPDEDGPDEDVPDEDESDGDEPDEDEPDAGTTVVKFEAEYVDIDYDGFIIGGGLSNTPASFYDQIQPYSKASNGYAVAATHRTGFNLKFEIEASGACMADLSVGLGSELGKAVTFSPNELSVAVNGSEMDYATISFSARDTTNQNFYDFEIGEVTLEEGINTVVLTVLENEYSNRATGGPIMDYVALEVDSSIDLIFANFYDNVADL